MAFFPTTGEPTTPAPLGIHFEAASLATRDGERLRGWILSEPAARATVVYFHGNGGNLSMWLPILVAIHQQGYEVRAIDYRGYGLSTGRPTERGLYRDVDALIEWVSKARRPDAPIIYWGRSLGATMAAYAATRQAPDGLILEAGFRDARSLLRRLPPLALLGLFSSYRFPTATLLEGTRCPTLVMHGEADRVVPFEAGRELFDAIRGPKHFFTIRGGDHNDLAPRDADDYWRAVNGFAEALGRSFSA